MPAASSWPSWVDLNGAKEIPRDGIFRGVVIRFMWYVFTCRLGPGGRWLLAPTVLISGYSLSSLEYQVFVAFCYLSLMWLVALSAYWWWRPRVEITAKCPERIEADADLPLDLRIRNSAAWTALDLRALPRRLPVDAEYQPQDGVSLPPLEPGQTFKAEFRIRLPKRGRYIVHGGTVETDFPFGLMRHPRHSDAPQPVLVYPRFQRLHNVELPVGRTFQPGGIPLLSQVGDSVEYIGNREYREGDSIRHIDWRATARLGKPIVREYREEYLHRVAVVLDTWTPDQNSDPDQAAFEASVSLAASLSDYITRQEHVVDLFAAGPEVYHLTAGRSLAWLEQILDILACVESTTQEPFTLLEPEMAQFFAQLTTVICIFNNWEASRRAFLNRLQSQGVGLRTFIVRHGGASACSEDPNLETGLGGFEVLTPEDVNRREAY